ncbi:PREDICTED: transcription repressor OFP8-like [Tarenaya hassleriana]|uniref:transcription repressor OFP8-like n=1 Tax=Tarenaya hassleriana TaxID=28532 RepID=UPI00053C653A|nr:PREDICTED: transcription repressor OFP8-like [Tarenaya hassleriana]
MCLLLNSLFPKPYITLLPQESLSTYTLSLSAMEKKLKLRLQGLVRSSFKSCRPRNLHDVVETSTLTSQTASFQRLFPSGTKRTDTPPRLSVREAHSSLFYNPVERHMLHPPAFPVFPANPFYDDSRSFRAYDKDSKMTKAKRQTRRRNCRKRSQVGSDYLFSSSSLDGSCRFKSTGSWCWSSSDDDDTKDNDDKEQKKELQDGEADSFFSFRSFSSDSSAFVYRDKNPDPRREADKPVSSGGVMPEKVKVRDSFAVVKKSRDPYDDFRTSMVEMIVERQIFAADDLQQLLQCFLLLNSRHHHGVIVEVFLEIYETLFSA